MIYFKNFMEILNSQHWYCESERIEIAKGKYELPTTYIGVFYNFKRRMEWLLKK